MNQSSPDAANSIDRNVGRKLVTAVAFAVVFIMVATSFFTAVVNADDEPPAIWTSQDEYAPGETVYSSEAVGFRFDTGDDNSHSFRVGRDCFC